MRLPFALAAVVCLLAGVVGGVAAAAATRSDDEPISFEPPRETPPEFMLRDQDGKWASPRDARGKVLVLTFLYSSCPDLCPTQGAKILDAVVAAGVEGIQVYGVSVDPEYDTPARARAFMRHNGLPPGPVRFLLGSRSELAPAWSAYGIVPISASPEERKPQPRRRTGSGAAGKPIRSAATRALPPPRTTSSLTRATSGIAATDGTTQPTSSTPPTSCSSTSTVASGSASRSSNSTPSTSPRTSGPS